MTKKRVVLTFPSELTEKPLTYHLVKDFDLAINILKAKITPGEEGKVVLELSNGSAEMIQKGLDFLIQQGVKVEPLSKELVLSDEECIHCGACTAVCRSEALQIDPKSARLVFNREKCIVCELCVPSCPLGIIQVLF